MIDAALATRSDFSGATPEAIQFHYDAGAQFFRLWLGETMTYTAAKFPDVDGAELVPHGLDAAQRRKIDHHLDALRLRPGQRMLDIGCGWGALMESAVRDCGVTATGLTLSAEQHRYIRSRASAGVEVHLQSYEHFVPAAPFDGIASVGAFEHFVKPGMPKEAKRSAYDTFFRCCRDWLKEGGRLSLQTIAWGDVSEEAAAGIPMQQFFPESDLPFLPELIESASPYFELLAFENRRRDYELTLKCWLTKLQANRMAAVGLVGEEKYRFYERCFQGGIRLFQRRKYYLCRLTFGRLPSGTRRENGPWMLSPDAVRR